MPNSFSTIAAHRLVGVLLLLLLPSGLTHDHSHSKERDEDVEPWDGKFIKPHGTHEFRVGDEIVGDTKEWFGGERGTVIELLHNKLNGKPMIKVKMASDELGLTTGYEKDWNVVHTSQTQDDAVADGSSCTATGTCAASVSEDEGLLSRRMEDEEGDVEGEMDGEDEEDAEEDDEDGGDEVEGEGQEETSEMEGEEDDEDGDDEDEDGDDEDEEEDEEDLEHEKFDGGGGATIGGGDYEFNVGDRVIGIRKGWYIEGQVGKVLDKWDFQGERHIMVEYEDGTGSTATAEKEWALYSD